MQILVHAIMTTTERGIIQWRKPKSIQSYSNNFAMELQLPQICNTIKLQSKTLPTEGKIIPINNATFEAKQWRKTEVYPTSSICVWTTFEQKVQDLYASQKIRVFPSLRRLKARFQQYRGHQPAYAITVAIFYIQKTTSAVKSGEHQKTFRIQKKLKTE